MALLLGVDTGGTYTDAAVLDDGLPPARAVLGKAKALTTRPDLSRGVAEAARRALDAAGIAPDRIALAALSTTLATNALVEGQGEPALLALIGFPPEAARRDGLDAALGPDPVIFAAGGHDAHGAEAAPFDALAFANALERALDAARARGRPIRAAAVAAQFSVRNPAHELAARELIRARAGLAATCSHELSARVGGPRRALTTLLNARLVGLIDRLVAAVEAELRALGIEAPLMTVRGDGALVSADFARARPIETILSGPAASLVGAAFLTGARDAVAADIGGTTTDIAVLRDGRPRLAPEGARVGGHATMVEAVAIAAHGLGGDSEARLDDGGLAPTLVLGPRRAQPLALTARLHPGLLAALRAQLAAPRPHPEDGRFLAALAPAPAGLDPREARIAARIAQAPAPMAELTATRPMAAAAERLIARGLARLCAFTPSDAAHVLGLQTDWDAEAARIGAQLMARRRGADGRPWADGPEDAARRTLARLRRLSAEAVLETALAEDGLPPEAARSPLAAAALEGRGALVRPSLTLRLPLIGLGAAARAHYPQVAQMLGARALIPEHADVANAVGAVAGRVAVTRRAVVTCPEEGRFRAHLPSEPRDFADFEAACVHAERELRAAARADAQAAGAGAVELRAARRVRRAVIEGREVIVEAVIEVEASGRPRLAAPD
ncbi:hydantoinase/oxoprolinase N-terminal domain-containing protein [Oceanicella actignis]|uniref:N-methylhydantoinase A/oxoprolinase/acetone carboxylase, beta subunit n=1 Tax=Oceanicella actignis TaxID=1189325 RepID=A0A1M7T9X6_9RHOB|nr:hydantoinase/oxoprolinase family protein [Oceanicella actignis]SET51551.1 N-methylhydantoinase A/oxoprolinase/acetone carboxylase, beta subunit [Oceanicella actignis]SHN67499.1 N-methylhydantoinase A/oxoprolinase/acetone carboxylase, beta subunit [Oceanicella actignis]